MSAAEQYYSHAKQSSELSDQHFVRTDVWKKTLEKDFAGIMEDVRQAVKRWNLWLRDCMRTETGLRISGDTEKTNVNIRVADGMPASFHQALNIEPGFLNLFMHLPLLRQTVAGLMYLEGAAADVSLFMNSDEYNQQSLFAEDIITKVANLVMSLEAKQALERVCALEEDVLGAYFLRSNMIEIYWMPIAIVSRLAGVSAEALTVVVMAHELAHAYTHVGQDIDGNRWETRAMQKAELRIIEGIAQHYTAIACDKLSIKLPEAKQAYEGLVTMQPEPYRVHLAWKEKYRNLGEVVRTTMMATRAQEVQRYDEFLYFMNQCALTLERNNEYQGQLL